MATIECVCPPKAGETRHPQGDTVTLRAKLDFRSALTARNTVVVLKAEDPDASTADILAALTEVYLLVGIESWSLSDERGKAVPVSRVAIRALMDDHPEAAMTIGDEADEMYSEAVIAPLVARAQTSSPLTPMAASTSATNGSSPKRPKRSRPSSISTTPTDGIERMSASPAGGSS